jgi:hypothetical protein
MGWLYHTNISPKEDTNNSFNEAFNIFLDQCLIHEERLSRELSGNNNCYRFLINTDDENDKIICKDGKFFLKSKFLTNKSFKKKLIDYYRPLGIYVKGPREISRRDGTMLNRWIIDLSHKY